MEKLPGWPENIRGTGRPAKYPWEKLADGTVWRLKRGEDFDVKTEHFRSTVKQYAARNNLNVRVGVTDPDTIIVQFERKS